PLPAINEPHGEPDAAGSEDECQDGEQFRHDSAVPITVAGKAILTNEPASLGPYRCIPLQTFAYRLRASGSNSQNRLKYGLDHHDSRMVPLSRPATGPTRWAETRDVQHGQQHTGNGPKSLRSAAQ